MRNRIHNLTVRLSDKESEQLKKNIRRCGLTKSAYIRMAVCGYIPKEKPPLEYNRMIKELNSIGNNLNQIARVANTTGMIDTGFYNEQVVKLDRAVLEINAAVTEPERIIYGNDQDMGHKGQIG
ncbi:MAG: plasmid mobilization relaxosome protein MobC [Oscillospiraceae bacterium]|nr:plasmid mobilization relaxosome protein MobC [Oscillospiraceae bacterium]